MRLFVTCLLSFIHLLYAQVQLPKNPHRQSSSIRAVQEEYTKMKMAIMMDVNKEMTVVDLNHVERTNVSNHTRSNSELENDIGFYSYNWKRHGDPVEYRTNNITDLLNNELFDVTEKTVVLVHGYLNNLTSPMIQLSLKALLDLHEVNVIAVDWYQVMAKQENVYVLNAADTFAVGLAVGRAMSGLIGGGLKRHMVHLVGHSLGAHVVSVAGKYLKQLNQTVARITGLDPAKIEFEDYLIPERISAGDAEFVDCIHSCGGYLSFGHPICQTDFYPNGGFLQPGCSFLSDLGCGCSHGRSYRYFAESILTKHTFPASKCTWTSEGLFGCVDSPQMMGYPAKPEYKGSYYVKTESDYPFSPAIKRPPVFNLWSKLQAWFMSIRLIIF